MRVSSIKLLDAATATGSGASHLPRGPKATFQAFGVTSSGSGAATVDIEASDDGEEVEDDDAHWVVLGTIDFAFDDTSSDDDAGFAMDAAWRRTRANVTAISGTAAAVTVLQGS